MAIEIVRLPVPAGTQADVFSYLDGQAYFAQRGLAAHRILQSSDGRPEVALILDWDSRADAEEALSSAVGKELIAGLEPLLAGPPEIAYYT